jgi:ABC-type phosphate transport system substrate-binding protein
MFHRRKSVGAALVVVATASSLVLSYSPADADVSPQPKDVVATGSDALQFAYNFLADGYHELPGYNAAGNRYRFVNFDSSGDAQGRSAFTDPRLLPTITGDGTNGTVAGTKYIKQDDVKLLNPTISLRAGQDLYVRPSGGSGGGTNAILSDNLGLIDVGRAPNALTVPQETTAQNNLGTKLIRVQFASDRQLIATAATTNAPTTLTAKQVLNIYNGTWKTWGAIPGWGTAAVPGSDASKAGETIIPLILPTDAGMWTTFYQTLDAQNPSTVTSDTPRGNSNSIQVQQNDATAITGLTDAQRPNAIMPFPRSRVSILNKGYFTDPSTTNAYNNTVSHRTPINANGIKLLDAASTTDNNTEDASFGGNFAVNALIRESDLNSTTPWQPGSTLNWVKALFYNPGGPAPFVKSPAGIQLLEAAGVTPVYRVFGTDTNEIPQS